ncbi:MAG: LPS assembly protein LptD [Pseudomonadota bacterium]
MAKWAAGLFGTLLAFAVAANATAQQPTEQVVLEADTIAEEDDGNLVIATGSVEATYSGRILRADRLIYDKRTGKVRASGNVAILDEDGTQNFADEVEVNDQLEDGYAVGFSTRLPEGGVATANSAVRQSNGINALDQAIFTACEVCEETGTRPTWALRARRAVLDQNNDIISYRDAVLEIAGLPVFYLPYFFHPDPTSGRRSGFLFPRVGVSGRLGAVYGQPYYQVLSPSSDITITPTFYTQVRPLLEAEYRKRFWSGGVNFQGSITFEQDFDNNGDRFGEEKVRGHVFGRGLFKINNALSWGFGVERASDDLFTRRYSIDGEFVRRGLFDGQPRTLLTQLFGVAQTQNFYGDIAILEFQDLRAASPFLEQPPITTPVLFSERLFDHGRFGRSSVQLSSAILSRDAGAGANPSINPDSRRVSLGAEWAVTRVLPGGFVVEPFADARGDYYNLDEDATGDANVGRFVGSFGTKLSWPLARPGKHVDLIVTPTVLGAWGLSNSNDIDIPIEDSQLVEFDETRLFDSNGFGNFDLYEGDGRLSVGVASTIKFKGRGPSIQAIAGRRWRSRTDDVFDVGTNLDGNSSDWVTGVAVDFGRILQANTRLRLDDDDFSFNRVDANVSTQFWRFSGSARYFRVDEDVRPNINVPDEGINLNSQFQVTKNWALTYGQLRDFTEQNDIRRSIGVIYSDNCSRFEIAYVRTESIDRTLGPNDSVFFRFTLKSLGEFGGNTQQRQF